MITVHHNVERLDLALGLVRVEGVTITESNETLAKELNKYVEIRRTGELPEDIEKFRKASRDMLRNGVYKPTGRGKPANEYLLRQCQQNEFPRINGVVDANNFISLKYMVPISVWDLDLANTDLFEFRLGQPEERYVFNTVAQELDLKDLVCGCGKIEGKSIPIVSPIKDSALTKIHGGTSRIAGCIYYSLSHGGTDHLIQIVKEFLACLKTCGNPFEEAIAILLPKSKVTF